MADEAVGLDVAARGFYQGAGLPKVAAAPNLAALFSQGPFARLADFEPDALRERPAMRDAVTF